MTENMIENKESVAEEKSFKCHKCNSILKNNSQLMKHMRNCVATVTQSEVEDITLNLHFDKYDQKYFNQSVSKQNNSTLQEMIEHELKKNIDDIQS